MRFLRRPFVVAVAVVLGGAGSAGSAGAAWTPGQKLDSAAVATPVLAANATGERVAAWSGPAGIEVATARPGRSFGASRTVRGSRGGVRPLVDIAPTGEVLIGWQGGEGCAFVRWSTLIRGRFSSARTAEPCAEKAHVIDLVIAGKGALAVLYGTARGASVQTATGAPRAIAGTTDPSSGLVTFAAGRPRVLVHRGLTPAVVEAAARRNGTWPRARRSLALPDAAGETDVRFAANGAGDEALSWRSWEPSRLALRAGGATRMAGKKWRAAVLAGTDETAFEPPAVAVGEDRTAVFSLRNNDWNTISTSIAAPGNAPGAAVAAFRTRTAMFDCPGVAVGAAGHVAHVFSTFNPGAPHGITGAIGSEMTTIDPIAITTECERPKLTVDRSGRATAIWARDDGLFAARGR